MTRAFREAAPADRERLPPERVFEAGLRNHHVSNTAYPLAHDVTWRPYRVPRERHGEVVEAAWEGVPDLALYVHVPFCETRCSFCEYTVTKRDEHDAADAHVGDILGELAALRDRLDLRDRRFHGFDLGGGTPTFLHEDSLARIADAVRETCAFEPGSDWSVETTPRIAADHPERLEALKRMGFDRVSMGVQVVEPDLLKVLGRSANGAFAHARAVENVRAAGFTRFNVDLMYGFAGQGDASWRATLDHAIGLDPEYITLYRMRYKLTRISHQAPSVTLEHVRPLQRLARSVLHDAGYHANPGKTTYSRVDGDVGTSSYLARRVRDGLPYLGIGLGAQSFSPTTISYNDGAAGKNLLPYARTIEAGRLPIQDLYDLPVEHVMGKFAAVSFYFGEIDRAAFRERFGLSIEERFRDEVAFVVERGLMEWTQRSLRLTPDGVGFQNGVVALFFAPSIQDQLLGRDHATSEDFDRNRRRALKVAG